MCFFPHCCMQHLAGCSGVAAPHQSFRPLKPLLDWAPKGLSTSISGRLVSSCQIGTSMIKHVQADKPQGQGLDSSHGCSERTYLRFPLPSSVNASGWAPLAKPCGNGKANNVYIHMYIYIYTILVYHGVSRKSSETQAVQSVPVDVQVQSCSSHCPPTARSATESPKREAAHAGPASLRRGAEFGLLGSQEPGREDPE